MKILTQRTYPNSKTTVTLIGVFAMLILLALLLAPGSTNPATVTNAQPALLAMAAEQPDAQVRVIIQKSDVEADVTGLVTQLGGTVIHELNIINAVAAEMTVETAVDLSFDRRQRKLGFRQLGFR